CALLMASSVSIVLKATGSDNGRWNTAAAKGWDRGTSKMTIRAVALDLGNTLVEYYEREDFRPILSESIRHAHDAFSHFAGIDLEEAQLIAASENHEHDDGKVRPLQDRFDRVFGLRDDTPSSVREQAGRAFLRPIFGRARKYEDTDLTLQALRGLGCKLA